MQCRKAVGPTWGFNPATMRWIYEVMVRPVLGYRATIWLNGTRTQNNEKLHNGVANSHNRSNVFYRGSGTRRDNWEHTYNTMAR